MNVRVLFVSFAALATVAAATAQVPGSQHEVRINLDELPPSAAPKPANGKAAPATHSTPGQKTPSATKAGAKKAPTKPAKAEPKMEGQIVSRGDRGYLGIQVVGNEFRINFYDREKKPMHADIDRIALRWPVQYQPNPERAVLSPEGDGTYVTSDKVVRPPYSFHLYVTLLSDRAPGDDPNAETYVVEFHQ